MAQLLDHSYKTIWRIAYPLLLGNFAQVMVSVTDTAFMGRVSEVDQAAIGYVGLLYFFISTVGFAFSKGTQILIAKRIGEERVERVGRVMDNSIVLLGVISIFVTAFLAFFLEPILHLLISDAGVLKASVEYMQIRLWIYPVNYLVAVYIAYYSGISQTKSITVVAFLMGGINIVLNYLLIFGHFGFPVMGIRGAAWASNIAEFLALAAFAIPTMLRKKHEEFELYTFRDINKGTLFELSDLSAPIVAQFLVGLGAWMTFFTLLEKMGPTDLAISNINKMVYALVSIPAFALAGSANTVISNIIGQGKLDKVIPAIRNTVVISTLWGLGIALLLGLFPRYMLLIFTEDIHLIDSSIPILYSMLVSLMIFSIATIIFNGIVSMGLTKISMLVEFATIVVYVAYIFSIYTWDGRDLWWMWSGEWVYWSIAGGISLAYLRWGNWRTVIGKK